jgi:23S rRNA (guanosine2251-2'-O)-methyltransferase
MQNTKKKINKKNQKKKTDRILLLDNIRSAENVGSLFRTSDAVGIDKIYLIGITPSPLDRFNRPNQKVVKASLGAEATISFATAKLIAPLIKKLKKEGYQIIAIEQSEKSVDYKKVKIKDKTVFILGNEVKGIHPKTLSISDLVAEIPMNGEKESLNVSVSGGIALFRMLGF